MVKINLKRFTELDARNRRIIINMILAVILRGSGILISFLLLPTYMGFFSEQSTLGLWFTLLAFMGWFITFDLGIANGLRNKLVEPIVDNQGEEIKKLISSSYGIIFFIVVLISIIALPIFSFINWQAFFNVDLNNSFLLKVVMILFLGIMVQFILKTVYSVLYALNKPSLVNFVGISSSILLLLALKLLPRYGEEENLYNLSIVYLFASTVPIILVTFYVRFFLLKSNFFGFKYIQFDYAKNVLSIGLVFFIIQILYLIISNTNEVFITATNSSEDVVVYRVYSSLFAMASAFFMVMMTPLWSEITTAQKKGEYRWMKNLSKRLYKFLALSLLMLALLTAVSQIILDLWLQEKTLQVNYWYCLVFSLFVFVSLWTSIVSSFANGLGKLKLQLIFMIVGVVLFISVIYFTRNYHNWIFVVAANIVAMLPYCIAQSLWLHQYFNYKLSFIEK